jgi:arsenite/tail-anchored protein-transporting ATPase
MMATATTTTMTTNRSFSFSSSRNNDNDSNRARSLKMMMTQNWKKSWNGNRSQLTAASTTLAASVGRRRGRQSDDERMTKTTKTARVLAAQNKNDTNTDTNSNNKNAFEEMSEERKRKYYLVGGKGGVGKTSLSASLAVKFAISGQHQTLIVSTDPAHSLSDSLAQDVSSGVPVLVEGTDGMLYAMEIDTTQASQEFSEFSKTADFTKGASDFMGSVGLSGISDSLKDLKLGELLDTPPPGLDEAIAIAKVVQFTKDEKYAKFTRIVFDTAPTGHTLRLLSLPEFLDKSIGKIVRLRQKLTSAGDLVKGLFGQQDQNQDAAVEKLENLKKRLQEVKDLFRNKETTEFVIATIPTVLGISESGRLLKSLREETVPCTRIVINQILNVDVEDFQAASEATTEAREKLERRRAQNSEEEEDEDVTDLMRESARLALAAKRAVNFVKIKEKDQRKAMEMLDEDPLLKSLQRIEAPLFDLEIRGVPALKYFADQVW